MGWSSPESLGGNLGYAPKAVSYTAGRLDVFGVDAKTNELQHWWYIDGFGWGGPVSLGGNLKYDPSAVSWDTGSLAVFGVDTNTNSLQFWSWDEESARHGAGWSGPDSLGGNLVSSLSAVSWAPGRLDVFGADTNTNELVHWWWDNGWGGPQLLGGNLASAPSAVSVGPGLLDIFAMDASTPLAAPLLHWWWNNGWNGPQLVGLQTGSELCAVSWYPGQFAVFAMDFQRYGEPNSLWYMFGGKGGLSESVLLANPDGGGSVGSAPSAVSWGPERLDVFADYNNGAFQPVHWWYTFLGWNGPEFLPGNWSPTTPSAVSWGPDRLDLFGVETDGRLLHWTWLP